LRGTDRESMIPIAVAVQHTATTVLSGAGLMRDKALGRSIATLDQESRA